HPGRGTFVKEKPDRNKFYLDRSFTRQMADMGVEAHSTVLAKAGGMIDANAPAALRSKANAPFFYLRRLRLGDGEPIGLQSTTIVTERCPGIERYDFSVHSLYDVLSN